MFTLKQSVGMIGGKPNHAHYFIGFNGKLNLFLEEKVDTIVGTLDFYRKYS